MSECGLNMISLGPQVEGPNTEGIQRLKLRDIFWDETTGERPDPSCLLDPTFLPHFCEGRQRNQPNKEDGIQGERGPRNREEKNEHTGQRCPYIDKNILWTNEREMVGIEDRDTTQRDGRLLAGLERRRGAGLPPNTWGRSGRLNPGPQAQCVRGTLLGSQCSAGAGRELNKLRLSGGG
ncbi:hypothetical protein F7725_007990 [Dissostichus mawsoni]|uniref:Uncharacterized protein n=1 Tax=Dissostichus mawsoni TaxID=36200 RepID=A0A7J5Y856_DISMA|nr:hypothetical protein F7725_007990 [Dissostichus mawsoni]